MGSCVRSSRSFATTISAATSGRCRRRSSSAPSRSSRASRCSCCSCPGTRAPPPARPRPPPAASSPAADADADARAESQGAAALRAAQELEIQLLELRRDVDAFSRERASYDDLRRRLDALDARRAPRGRFDDWASLPGAADGLRFSGNGFVVRSPDNRFLMRPGLRLQTVYEGSLARGTTPGQ